MAKHRAPGIRPERGRHRARRPRRGLAALVSWALVATVAVIQLGVATPPAEAAITTPFTTRFQANTNGDILIRGNTLLSCVSGATNCAAARAGTANSTGINNNNFTMAFVDVDSDLLTRSSSTADVTLPPDSTVLFAGLYWGAYSGTGTSAPPAGTARDRLLLKPPGATAYRTITASTVSTSGNTNPSSYQSFADVTSIVAGARGGTYAAADIAASAQAADRFAGWSLVIAVAAPTLPTRNLTVFDGYGVIENSTGNTSVDIPVSGFTTPPAGAFVTRLGTVVYEGDRGSTGDTFTLIRQNGTQVPISNATNPQTNPFNSTITDAGVAVGGRNPAYDNTLGFDADVFESTALLGNSERSATLRLSTGGETFFPGVVTFATELFAPRVTGTKTQATTDVDGDGAFGPGDRITYTIDVLNDGRDAATDVALTDAIPLGSSYVPGSLTVDGAAVTDAADGDRGEVVGGSARVRLGASPGATGGRLGVGSTTRVRFAVTATAGNPDGTQIVNRASITYAGEQTGQALAGASTTAATSVTAPRSDLRVIKEASAPVVQRAGDRALTWTIRVVNDGPKPDSDVSLVDELPDGFTPTGVSGPGCALTGSTVRCDAGALGVGGTVSFTITGTVDADAPDPVVNTASASGASVDPDPADNAATVTTEVNTAPVAGPDAASITTAGVGASVDVAVLANDSDPDGDPLTVQTAIVVPPAHGSAIVDGGIVRYVQTDAAFVGTDTVSYTVCDDRGGCSTQTISITVPNTPPSTEPDRANTASATPVTIPVLANDRDVNGDALTVGVPPTVPGGTVAVVDGAIVFTPTGGFQGESAFSYTVCDTRGACVAEDVLVVVDGAAPDAHDDRFVTRFQTPITITSAQLLANDTDPNPGDTLTVTGVRAAVGGTVELRPNGDVVFTPAAGFTGTARFVYDVADPTGRVDEALVWIDVPNTAPVALDDVVSTGHAQPVVVPVLANDSDAESPRGDLIVTLTSSPGQGQVRTEDGQIVYVAPADGFEGQVEFGYQVCDPQGLCATATVRVTVRNAAPVAVDNERATTLDQPVTVPVLANDGDPNPGDVLRLTRVVAGPANGTATVNADGTLTYRPNTGFAGADRMTYEVCDSDPEPACATAVLTVDVVDQAPTAFRDAYAMPHVAGEPTVRDLDVLANDVEPDGQPLTVTAVTQPAVGTVEITAAGVRYTAPSGFVGIETFTYEASDGVNAARTTVTVTVENASPLARADDAATTVGAPVTIRVLDNDADPDGDPLSLAAGAVVRQPASGTVVVDPAAGTITYTPTTTTDGDDSFDYVACDPYGSCALATVTVAISNTRPVADDDTADVQPGAAVIVDVLANDRDPDGGTVGAPVITAPPSVGGATVDPLGRVVYTAPTGVPEGTVVAIEYEVCDAPGSCDRAVLYVTIGNEPPVVVGDAATTSRRTPVQVRVLDNDSDANGTTLVVTAVTQPAAGGTVALDGAGLPVLTPDGTVVGPVSFTYTACDPAGACGAATVTVEVTNAAPVAVDDADSVAPGGAVTIPVLVNDVDADGDPLTVTAVTDPDAGTVEIAGGTLVFTAPPGTPAGVYELTYTVSDGLLTATATVTVTVTDAPPLADPDTAVASRFEPVVIDVRANDGDPNGDVLGAPTIVVAPASGTARVLADGRIEYVPDGATGAVTFTYRVCDPAGNCGEAVVTVVVTNAAPVAAADTASVEPGETVSIPVLGNDGDPDPGDTITLVRIVDGPSDGTVVLGATGVDYTAPAGFTGPVTFTYEITDGALTAIGTVTVTVLDVAPVAVDDAVSTSRGAAVTVDVRANDREPNGQPLGDPEITAPPAAGTAAVLPDGSIRYEPAAGQAPGPVTIGYRVCDPSGLCGEATLTVTVTNAAPVAVADADSVAPGGTTRVPVLANDADADGDPLTIVAVTQPTTGSAVVDGDVIVVTMPLGTPAGAYPFTYTIGDGTQQSTATVTITVSDSPPLADDDRATTSRNAAVTIDVRANDGDDNADELSDPEIVDGPATGAVTVNADGTVTYDPRGAGPGDVTFTYEVCDPDGRCDVATVTVTVTNTAPAPQPDVIEADPAQSVRVPVLANDADPDPGDTLTVTAVSGGTAVIDGDEIVVTAPASGVVVLTYEVSDGAATATSTITVTVRDLAPVAADDAADGFRNAAVTVDVLANDRDPNGAALAIGDVAAPPGTTVTVDGGSLVVTPPPGFVGRLDVTYQACDPSGRCDTATLVLTVANRAPLAVADGAVVAPGGSVSVPVLGNDSDLDGDALTVAAVTQPVLGTVAIVDGLVVYVAPPNAPAGDVTFTYTITDGLASAEAVVTVTISDGPPVAVDDTASTSRNAPVTIDVRGNDGDPNGDVLTAPEIVTPPAAGAVTVNADGTVTYDPQGTGPGTVTFTYRVCDPAATCDDATVTVDVTNAAPAPAPDVVDTAPGTPLRVPVLGNDTDPDAGDTLTLVSVDGGGATVDGGDVVLTAPLAGEVVLTYVVSDGVATATATLTVRVADVAPVANDDTAEVFRNGTVRADVLANDTDANAQPIVVASVRAPAGTTVVVDGGTLVVTPPPGFTGTLTISYTACSPGPQPGSQCDDATLTVTVVDRGPVAVDDVAAVDPGGSVTVPVLANDGDPDGDPLTVTAVTQPTVGSVAIVGGEVVFTAPADAPAGQVSFTYTVSDGELSATATVVVTIGDAAPDAADDRATTTRSVEIAVDVLANDADPLGDGLVLDAIVAGPDPVIGTAAIVDGRVVFRGNGRLGPAGPAVITYRACDARGRCAEAVLTIDVVNTAPVAADDAAEVRPGRSVEIAVLANDRDPDAGDTLAVVGVSAPAAGSVAYDRDTVVYSAPAGFSGVVTFTYDVSDGLVTVTRTVTVTVGPPGNAPPVAADDTARAVAGEPVLVAVLANDDDPDGDPLTITEVTQPVGGTAEIVGGTAVVITPDAGATGPLTVTYTVCDPGGLCAEATVTVEIVAPERNEPPAFTAQETNYRQVIELGELLVPLGAGDPDGDAIVFALVDGALPPGVTLAADGSFTGAPTAAGTWTATVRVCDDGAPQLCAETVLEIVVTQPGEPTPPPTTPPGPAPSPTRPPDQPGPGGGDDRPGSGGLPGTGAAVAGLGVVAALLLAAGAALVALTRRRGRG